MTYFLTRNSKSALLLASLSLLTPVMTSQVWAMESDSKSVNESDLEFLKSPQASFQFTLTAKVPNDMMRAVVGLTVETSSLSQAQDQINEAMDWAAYQIKKYPTVTMATADVGTSPVYTDEVLTGYRAWQNLELTTSDFNQLTSLVGILQDRLGINEIAFYPSEKALRDAEMDMMSKAADEAQRRVKKLGDPVGYNRPKLISLDINPDNSNHGFVRTAPIGFSANSNLDPVLPAGESTVKIRVNAVYKMR